MPRAVKRRAGRRMADGAQFHARNQTGAPGRRRRPFAAKTPAQRRLRALLAEAGSWVELERITGVNRGVLYGVAHGKRRASKALRVALGLVRPRGPRVNWRRREALLRRWVRRTFAPNEDPLYDGSKGRET